MKRKGNFSLYEKERNQEIYDYFKMIFSDRQKKTIDEISVEISRLPSKRFWVSRDRAAIVISQMMKGRSIEGMRPLKREMYKEIFRRVMQKKKECPSYGIPRIVGIVVRQKAPSFYLRPYSIRKILYRIINGWYEKRKDI